jgi:hypothetical protein
MSRIYIEATTVVAWLGEGPVENTAAIYAIEEIQKTPAAHWYALEHEDADNIERRNPDIVKHDWVKGMNDIISCQWWKRVWALQEAVLAAKLTFLVGHRIIPFENLFATSEIWQKHAENKCCYLLFSDLKEGMSNILNLTFRRTKHRRNLMLDREMHLHRLNRLGSLGTSSVRQIQVIKMNEQLQKVQDKLFQEYDEFTGSVTDLRTTEENHGESQMRFEKRRE